MLDDPFALLSKAWLVQEMGFQVGRARPRSRVGGRQLGALGNVHFRELLEQPGYSATISVRTSSGPIQAS